MQPIVVNADYDEILAGGVPKPAQVKAIECLAFWVQDAPLKTQHEYSPEYLAYVAQHSGRKPRVVKNGTAINWWGELGNLELEKKINSKIWARRWWQQFHDFPGVIVHSADAALNALPATGQALIKRDHGMSGRGHWKTSREQWNESQQRLKNWFSGGVIVEPLYERISDLSALWLPEEKRFIFYRNIVDDRFQWLGCRIENNGTPFFSHQEEALLEPWREQLVKLATELQLFGYQGPFSVDAFFHLQDGELAFYPCSEINARKTMGWVAYNLLKIGNSSGGELKKASDLHGNSLLLSPEKAVFSWCWERSNA